MKRLYYWQIAPTINVLRFRRWVIFGSLMVSVSIGVCVLLWSPHMYMSSARIAVDYQPPKTNEYGMFDVVFGLTPFEEINSTRVLYPVIEELKLDEKWLTNPAERTNFLRQRLTGG
jgi:uncharacterized protein involved in exopolysaccharide biosynthesis